jgi:hypothetical protein
MIEPRSDPEFNLEVQTPSAAISDMLRPLPQRTTSATKGARRRDRLGGLLHEYLQVA